MRGRIIHYNSNDGKGLISADNKQYPFEIGHWQSETAPALNAVVEFDGTEARPTSVKRVPDEVIMRERAGELAGKLSALGSGALQSAQGAAAHANVGNPIAFVGKPALIAQGAFAFGALFLSFVSLNTGMGLSPGFTLAGLSKLSEQMGMSMGSGVLVWLAIVSLAVPILWRNRLAWLALMLPLIATLMPVWNVYGAVHQIGANSGMGTDFSQMMAKQVSQMISLGLGAPVCFISALVLAAIALKRFLLAPAY